MGVLRERFAVIQEEKKKEGMRSHALFSNRYGNGPDDSSPSSGKFDMSPIPLSSRLGAARCFPNHVSDRF